MSTKLFVAGLPYSLTTEQLTEYFSQAGNVVSANIITDRDTGQSRGFGFVEMASEEEAQKAISTLDNTELSGRRINVKEAKPQENRQSGGYSSGFRNNRDRRGRDNKGGRRSNRW